MAARVASSPRRRTSPFFTPVDVVAPPAIQVQHGMGMVVSLLGVAREEVLDELCHRRRAEEFDGLRAVTDNVVRHEALVSHPPQDQSVGKGEIVLRSAQPGLRVILHVDAK